MTAGQGLERGHEAVAHLTALGDPAEARSVRQKGELVGLQLDGFIIVATQGADEPGLGPEPVGQLVLASLDDAQGHGRRPCKTADCLAFPAIEGEKPVLPLISAA